MEAAGLNIGNICHGAVPEVFDKAVMEIFKNMKDPNTVAEATRSLTIEFKFEPFKDRSGAQVTFAVKTKLTGIEPVQGTVFIAQTQNGGIRAFAKDPRQDALFTEPAASSSVS